MKIDKIVFSCSELFSPFWNVQSCLWKNKFNIHPVCLFFGDKSKSDLSEEFGDVLQMNFDPRLPDIIQIQFSKFYHATTEPNTTWMVGDIDLIPLQTDYFLCDLPSIPENSYCHLNFSMCGQMWGMPSSSFFTKGSRLTGGFDLPAHYHCAKGLLFKKVFFPNSDMFDVVSSVVSSGKYGMRGMFAHQMDIRGDYWIAEETYTSEMLWNYYFSNNKKCGESKMFVKEYDRSKRSLEGKYGSDLKGSICPKSYENGKYLYELKDIERKRYVEVHCPLPFEEQKESLYELLIRANMLDKSHILTGSPR